MIHATPKPQAADKFSEDPDLIIAPIVNITILIAGI